MAEAKREYFFQCQYQVEKDVIASNTVKDIEYISIAKMIISLCSLAVEVKNKVDAKTGGRVALEVMFLIKDLIRNRLQDRMGHGESSSTYMNRTSKHKANRSERVDIIFYGLGGMDKKDIEPVSRFIHYFQK